MSYKKDFEQTKAKNEFKPTDTESYKEMKQVANACSDVRYLTYNDLILLECYCWIDHEG